MEISAMFRKIEARMSRIKAVISYPSNRLQMVMDDIKAGRPVYAAGSYKWGGRQLERGEEVRIMPGGEGKLQADFEATHVQPLMSARERQYREELERLQKLHRTLEPVVNRLGYLRGQQWALTNDVEQAKFFVEQTRLAHEQANATLKAAQTARDRRMPELDAQIGDAEREATAYLDTLVPADADALKEI